MKLRSDPNTADTVKNIAAIFSFVEICRRFKIAGTAELCGLDPSFYLRTVRTRIADHPINRIGEFLSWNVAATLQSEAAEAA